MTDVSRHAVDEGGSGTPARRWEGEAPAKTNLFLRILAREESGWHQLETLFIALGLADRVAVELDPSPRSRGAPETRAELGGVRIELSVRGVEPDALGPADRNLAVRAVGAYVEGGGFSAGRPARVRVELDKRIPHGGGLGGGSSDAAAVLAGLDTLSSDPLGRARLLELGAGLGSDIPFFLTGRSLALAWGRGERLLALPALPVRPVLLVVPPVRIATPDAYAALASDRAREDDGGSERPRSTRLLDLAGLGSWEDIRALAGNDFEDPIEDRHPRLAALRRELSRTGAMLGMLSGSGSTLVGIYTDDRARDRAASILESDRDVRVVRTRTRSD